MDDTTTQAMLLLEETIKLFGNDPAKWTQGVNARSANGTPANSGDENAVCWCINGGLLKTTTLLCQSYLVESMVNCAFIVVANRYGHVNQIAYNDYTGRTFKEVLSFMQETLEVLPTLIY